MRLNRLKFEKKITKSIVDKIERIYADELKSDGYYKTKLNVLFKAKGTEFYIKLPLTFKLGKSSVVGSVNQIKIYFLTLILMLLVGSFFYLVRHNVIVSLIFGGLSGVITYVLLRNRVLSSINNFFNKY